MRTINEGKSFYIMFDALDGGTIETLELSPDNLKPTKSIILLDEDTQTVWLWHGKSRGLVSRRTALRQAQSLKGHGYQTGNAIVGRDLRYIREIDDRKVGRVPEDTEASKEFLAVLNRSYENIGNKVYTVSSGDVPSELKTEEKVEKPKEPKLPPKPEPEPEPKPEPEISKPVPDLSETPGGGKYKLKHVEVPKKPKEPPKDRSYELSPAKETKPIETKEPSKFGGMDKGNSQIAAAIMSVMELYKDIWISKRENGVINIEQMDGKICSFKLKNNEIDFLPGSFTSIPEEKKNEIQSKFQEFTGN